MSIGLGTYAFFWRHSSAVGNPLDLPAMFAATAALDVHTFQICDYPAIENYSDAGLGELRAQAGELGIDLELGVRGIRATDLRRQLDRARALGASTMRSMLFTTDDRPSIDEAFDELTAVVPEFEQAGVTLALETYEQVATAELVALVDRVDSGRLGICLDVANTIARLENQREVIDRVQNRVVNLHVKDFTFTRAPGLVGFELTGERLGDGLLELDYLFDQVNPFARGISAIVEHWLPWQGAESATVALEEQWTARSVDVMKRREEAYKSTG